MSVNEQSSQPPPAKKSRPVPPLEDFKNFEVVLILRALQRSWNCQVEGYINDQDRDEFLTDMGQLVKTGAYSYRNPFGADDREAFADSFG